MNKISVVLIAVIIFFVACNGSQKFKTHEKGFDYKMITDVEGDQINNEDILEITVKYFNNENDSLLFDSKDIDGKFRVQVVDSDLGGIFQDALKFLTVGDSAHFLIPASDFFMKTAQSVVPDFISDEGVLRFEVNIEKYITREELQKEREEYMKTKSEEEAKILEEYLSVEGITISPTESGLYIIPLEKGKGKKAEPGKFAVVHYTGTLLNGQKFDSSLDRGEPFEFELGARKVISAWDEAVATMRVGDKIKIIAPSVLAYGPRGAGGSIPPFSTLIFEIKLLDVKDSATIK